MHVRGQESSEHIQQTAITDMAIKSAPLTACLVACSKPNDYRPKRRQPRCVGMHTCARRTRVL